MIQMLFEWDDNKEKINIAKHGIDFSTAAPFLRRPAGRAWG